MGAKWTSRAAELGGKRYHDMANRGITQILFEELQQAGREGEAEAKKFIGIAGTQKQWSGSFPDLRSGTRRDAPGRGRVNTGAMREAISYKVTKGTTVQARVGWINRYEDYFGYQDQGFSAGGYRERVQDPVSAVEGMKLMAHMSFYMRDRLDEAGDRALKRIANGL